MKKLSNMRHNSKKIHLGRKQQHRTMLFRELASNLFLYEKMETTEAKAKKVRPYIERLITLAKADSVASRRKAVALVSKKSAIKKLFEVIGPKYKARAGGYTRIRKSLRRAGDSAPTAIISLV
jgi:large subunit ribosomal protein L17